MYGNKNYSPILAAAVMVAVLTIAGCGSKPASGPGGMAGAAMSPSEVSVVTIQPQNLPVTSELPGRLNAIRTAQVRARVAGVLLRQDVRGGSDVKAGQPLFQIDPSPLQAALNSARANLSKAIAGQGQAGEKARRYKELVGIEAVSKLDYVNAAAAAQQANADVAAARAAVQTARLNLGYATVRSPITGHMGTPSVTEGALVGQNEATLLATVQQLDPIYLDLTESSADVLKLRRAVDSGQLKSVHPGEANVSLTLEDGSVYAHSGKLLFSDVTVDQGTGMITLRAEFPNPDHLLLPGMYARARFEQAVDTNVLLIPQQSLVRGPNGTATVMAVGPDGKAAVRPVTVGKAVGDKWVITSGLKAGDRVIVDGLQKAKPGLPVKAVSFTGATATQVTPTAAPAAKAQ
jgi:membrane fusion protein, multidrug efflux system